ncbi:hypothetical protein PAXRUDRAFT_829524 [Paxillus rubicundulus Ve08.2h10]|uniref:F-box domain-containing protein n=1 Tax=Paxillus rubicundulus Ve08.2h10 TaxID=930991 RepID=A0A0D0D7N3_9AGAM|nr:hypothetical protein PAXRUDRAFT_829524 [Paxillus rubicundulus Ve08.2h10]
MNNDLSTMDRVDNAKSLPALSTTSINSLPPELLIEIFVTASRSGGPFTPLVLFRVSKLWREICIASPRVWQLIIVNESRRSISSVRLQAELWIARSAPLPFGVDIELTDFEHLLPIMSYFLPKISRWLDCKISFDGRTTYTSLSDLTLSAPRRVLHHLDVRLKVPFDEDGDDDDDIFFSCGTNILRHVSMKITASDLPSADFINPLLFTSLDITETSFTHYVRSPELFKFLARCPNLEHFYLHGVGYRGHTFSTSPPVVALPRLHTLLLDLVCNQRSVLSHLHLPSLRELHLRHLNTETPLLGYHTDEEGDSDDEAHDFSQSPSSDHHTGMGLRKLILRSRPPLEILDMDLSDMRTKDFKWVFDRLTHLKHFSIVGSDMSNDVVRLFKPQSVKTNPGDSEGSLRVRLPQLTTLKLFGCQELSGEALVEALSARVRYTDVATPNETLTNVSISGCNEFTTTHGLELSWYLHDRLRFS